MSKFITFSTLNSCSLLYFNCSSIKLFLKNHFLRDFSIMYKRVLAPPRQIPSLIQFCFASLLTSFPTQHGGMNLLLIPLLPILHGWYQRALSQVTLWGDSGWALPPCVAFSGSVLTVQHCGHAQEERRECLWAQYRAWNILSVRCHQIPRMYRESQM